MARWLLADEAARHAAPAAGWAEAVRVCERFRQPLVTLTGLAGFRSLLSRAVAVAKAEVPTLTPVQVLPDGSLHAADAAGRPPDGEAGAAVVAQLLWLLVTFIGEPLTQHLVRGVWPAVPGIDLEAEGEEGV